MTYVYEKTFEKIDFRSDFLTKGEYEYCIFKNCDFSNSSIEESIFLKCEFIGCNLSLLNLTQAAFKDVKFKNNKMVGLRFENCAEFALSFSFENCILNHSTFYKTKLKKTYFIDSQLQECDFMECDLSSSLFDNCDLNRAIFEKTIIENSDFRTAYNYSIDPEKNRIKKAKFSLIGVSGLLDKYGIKIEN